MLQFGDLVLNRMTCQVHRRGELIESKAGTFPAALRRKGKPAIRTFRFGSRSASIPRPLAAGSVDLTNKEFDLLEYFMVHPNQVILQELFLERIWGVRL